jgi:hypothetical protein
MIGHYFDIIYSYVKDMTRVYNRDQSLLEGFSKDLVYFVAKNLGVDFENGNSLEELWNYTLGLDSGSNYVSQNKITTEDTTKEIWKRIINNLPYLLKTKGTERGVRALINCFGIPSTILRIREYGGAETDFDTKNDMVYERFNYSTKIGYQEIPVDGNTARIYQYIQVPWKQLNNGYFPYTVELRAKMNPNQTSEQKLMEVPDRWVIKAFTSASNTYMGFFLSGSSGWSTSSVSCSIYDGTWHHVALTREYDKDVVSANTTYTLSVRKTNYQKVVANYTASYTTTNNTRFLQTSSLWIGGSGSFVTPAIFVTPPKAIWSGSVQEFRYWTTPLQNAILDNHALAPTSFQGNLADTHTGSTSSFSDLAFRLCLGADNNRINYSNQEGRTLVPSTNVSYSISQHPNQFTSSFKNETIETSTGSFWGYGDGEFYYNQFNRVQVSHTESNRNYGPEVEIHSLEWPDLGGNRSVSNKIRIENVTTNDDQLYRNNSIQVSLADNQPIDSPRLGIYFSPTNEVNQDIAEQFGGISIDDYIGNPSHTSLDHYPDLEKLYNEYGKKYTKRNNTQEYVRLIGHYDSALFQMIKKFVPYRANTQVGLLIEPHLLNRSKLPTAQPSYTAEHYSSSLDLSVYYEKPGGFIQDGDGEPFRDGSGYVETGTIGGDESDYIAISGDQQYVAEFNDLIVDNNKQYQAPRKDIEISVTLPETDYDMVVDQGLPISHTLSPTGTANEYNNNQLSENPSQESAGTLYETIDLGQTGYGRDARVDGSQYMFMSWRTSGSGATTSKPYMYTSSRYDYHECLPPIIQTARFSEVATDSTERRDVDIYYGRAFTDNRLYTVDNTTPNSIQITDPNITKWTRDYGLVLTSLKNNATAVNPYNGNVSFNKIRGLELANANYGGADVPYELKAKIPAFYYNQNDPQTLDLLYDIRVTLGSVGADSSITMYLGELDGSLYQTEEPNNQEVTYTYKKRKATGPWLGLKLISNGTVTQYTYIRNISVTCLNYKAQVQDYHLRNSYGMKNARHYGCKMTSADWNIDSPDTIDKGPVVSVTVGGGAQLQTTPPGPRGNFTII